MLDYRIKGVNFIQTGNESFIFVTKESHNIERTHQVEVHYTDSLKTNNVFRILDIIPDLGNLEIQNNE